MIRRRCWRPLETSTLFSVPTRETRPPHQPRPSRASGRRRGRVIPCDAPVAARCRPSPPAAANRRPPPPAAATSGRRRFSSQVPLNIQSSSKPQNHVIFVARPFSAVISAAAALIRPVLRISIMVLSAVRHAEACGLAQFLTPQRATVRTQRQTSGGPVSFALHASPFSRRPSSRQRRRSRRTAAPWAPAAASARATRVGPVGRRPRESAREGAGHRSDGRFFWRVSDISPLNRSLPSLLFFLFLPFSLSPSLPLSLCTSTTLFFPPLSLPLPPSVHQQRLPCALSPPSNLEAPPLFPPSSSFSLSLSLSRRSTPPISLARPSRAPHSAPLCPVPPHSASPSLFPSLPTACSPLPSLPLPSSFLPRRSRRRQQSAHAADGQPQPGSRVE